VKDQKVAVIQSNYIPWKGYFDFIRRVDEFVLFDDVQYTRRDWRNRNRIKTPQGVQWLTIPVKVTGKYFQKIQDTEIDDPGWAENHWKTLCHAYARARCFGELRATFEELYLGCRETLLSEVNRRFLTAVNAILEIETRLSWSREYPASASDPNHRLLEICQALRATEYVSGLAARDYLDVALFEREGIRVTWMDYAGYPEYPQLHPPFEHAVSIVDLLFNVGWDAPRYLKTFEPVGSRRSSE
jgi:hypothetical protein